MTVGRPCRGGSYGASGRVGREWPCRMSGRAGGGNMVALLVVLGRQLCLAHLASNLGGYFTLRQEEGGTKADRVWRFV